MGQGDMSPPLFMKGTSMVMSPQYLGVYFSSNSNNCCLLYFNANIMCSFTKKIFSFWGQTPYRGSAPGPRWWTSVTQTPSLLLCPPIIMWDRRPRAVTNNNKNLSLSRLGYYSFSFRKCLDICHECAWRISTSNACCLSKLFRQLCHLKKYTTTTSFSIWRFKDKCLLYADSFKSIVQGL